MHSRTNSEVITAELSHSGIINTEQDGLQFIVRQSDGFINATSLCQQAGREFKSWHRSDSTKAFLEELSTSVQICTDLLVQVIRDGLNEHRGTWVHPDVALSLTMWLSPKFQVACIKVVRAYLEGRLVPAREKTEDEIVLEALQIQQKKIAAQEAKIRELTPKAAFADKVLDSPDLLTFTQTAKWLNMKSGQEMTKWLNSQGVIFKQSKTWLPYAKYSQLGYFRVITHTEQIDGENRSFQHTKITQSGKEFILRLWNQQSSINQLPATN